MPIKDGWEVSPDRHEHFEKMLNNDDLGEPILTSKCFHAQQGAHGFLIVSTKGIAWSEKLTLEGLHNLSFGGSSKWVRWHDVVSITPFRGPFKITPGAIVAVVIKRKQGVLKKNKRGTPKTKELTFRIYRNKKESKAHFEQRKTDFLNIMKELYYKYKAETYPQTSDSRT